MAGYCVADEREHASTRWSLLNRDSARWVRRHRPTYITGPGRSGTKWVADALNAHRGCVAFHEPLWRYDYCNAVIAPLMKREFRTEYLSQRRSMLVRMWGAAQRERGSAAAPVEVNSMLWPVASWLRSERDDPSKVILLVRDPVDTVASWCHRLHYRDETGPRSLIPEPRPDWWDTATRCERIAWQWSLIVTRVADVADSVFRLEELVSDFEWWSSLCAAVGVRAERSVWDRKRDVRRNEGPREQSGDFDAEAVWSIAGDAAQRVGYVR